MGNFTDSCTITVSDVERNIQVTTPAGIGRYDTAVKLSKNQFSTADTIVIANGEAMADGLGATPPAAYKKAPLLLTETYSLPDVTLNEIKDYRPKMLLL